MDHYVPLARNANGRQDYDVPNDCYTIDTNDDAEDMMQQSEETNDSPKLELFDINNETSDK